MSDLLKSLQWRYATKKFDTTKKVSPEDMNELLEAIRYAPSSDGVQAMKVFVVTNPEIREKLKAAAYGQPQIADASHFLVFTVPQVLKKEHIDSYVNNIAKQRNQTVDQIQSDFKARLYSYPDRDKALNTVWMKRQAYISLGFLLLAAAIKRIDVAPMEGFNPQQFNEILGLDKLGYESVVIASVGYRAEDDKFAKIAKVRFPQDDLFEFIK